MSHETHFVTFWRELDARLIAECDAPATHYEAVARYRGPSSDMDAVVSDILRRRIVIGFQFAKAA
jgi:hypothetical protein